MSVCGKLPFLNISWSRFHRRFTIQYGDEQLNIQFTYINQALLQYVNMKHFLQTKKKYVILFQSQTKTMATYPLGRAVLERQKQGWVPPTSLILQISEARSYFYTQGPAKDQFRKELNRATRQRELQVSECVHIRDTKLDRSAEFPAINVQRCHQDTRSIIFLMDH